MWWTFHILVTQICGWIITKNKSGPKWFNLGVQVWFRTVLCTPSLTRPGFELMTSRSWQDISYYWDACSSHLVITDFQTEVLRTTNSTQLGFGPMTLKLWQNISCHWDAYACFNHLAISDFWHWSLSTTLYAFSKLV